MHHRAARRQQGLAPGQHPVGPAPNPVGRRLVDVELVQKMRGHDQVEASFDLR